MHQYDSNQFGLSEKMIQNLFDDLKSIETKGFKRVMIHGDAVFSNVIMTNNNQIKFVDVKGIEKDFKTCFGHPLYDFAKIYQSLIGYDEILLDKKIKISYKSNLVKFFESQFDLETLEKIKKITASLLFSMIPLHNEVEKFEKYINIGKKLL